MNETTCAPHDQKLPDDPTVSIDEYNRLAEIIQGFRATHLLFAAHQVHLFEAVEGGQTIATIAQQTGTDTRAIGYLLDALWSLGMLQKQADRYDNTPFARDVFLPTGRTSLHNIFTYLTVTAKSWADLSQVLRAGEPTQPYAHLIGQNPEFLPAYAYGMAEIAQGPARQLAAELALDTYQTCLDVGGGPGMFSAALIDRAPHLQVTVLEQAGTIDVVRSKSDQWPHVNRVVWQAGDYLTTPFGVACYDLILMSHITHNEGEAENQSLLRKAYQALRPGGQVVIHDFLLEEDGKSPLFSALFAIHMLVLTARGRVYQRETYTKWLQEAGFREIRAFPIGAGTINASTAMIATKLSSASSH